MSNHFWTYNLIIAMMVLLSTLIIVLGICFFGDLSHGAAVKVAHTFYGFPDNDPAGPATAYNCGRGFKAGGTGTYDDPLTFASAAGEFEQCEIIYDPYLSKYLINEDFCQTCDNQWKNGGTWHIDVWTGHNEINGGGQQMDCENRLTPAPDMEIIRRPARNLPVDATALFNPAGFWCSLDHVNPNFVLTDAVLNGTGPAIHPAHPSQEVGVTVPPSQQTQEGGEGKAGETGEEKEEEEEEGEEKEDGEEEEEEEGEDGEAEEEGGNGDEAEEDDDDEEDEDDNDNEDDDDGDDDDDDDDDEEE